MRISLIPPKLYLDTANEGQLHFILAHRVLEDEDYAAFYRQNKMYKLMDNGAYELGKPLDFDEIIEAARACAADEIIIPDILKDREGTFKLTEQFFSNDLRRIRDYKLMLVPQGKDPNEWILSYIDITRQYGWLTNAIGIPIWLEKDFGARAKCVMFLLVNNHYDPIFRHHLLGLDDLGELFLYQQGTVASLDTSLPYSAAYGNVFLNFLTKPDHKERVPYDGVISDTNILRHNIQMLKEAAYYGQV